MKLRNKKTGEIGNLVNRGLEDERIWVWINNISKPEYRYNSLAELNEEWEDYEDPKKYWTVECGVATEYTEGDEKYDRAFEAVGLKFDTKEECERAIEKLKAWKRLEDKGFRFDPVDRYEALCGNGFNIPITATMPPEAYTDAEISKDLDICFGGEE